MQPPQPQRDPAEKLRGESAQAIAQGEAPLDIRAFMPNDPVLILVVPVVPFHANHCIRDAICGLVVLQRNEDRRPFGAVLHGARQAKQSARYGLEMKTNPTVTVGVVRPEERVNIRR